MFDLGNIKPWDRQPQEVTYRDTGPLASKFDVLHNFGSGLTNAITGRLGSTTTAGFDVVRGERAIKSTGAGYVNLNNVGDYTAQPFFLAFRFTPTALSGNAVFVYKGPYGGSGYYVQVFDDGRIYLYGGVNYVQSPAGTIVANTTYDIVININPGTASNAIYRNGAIVSSFSNTITPTTSSNNLNLFAYNLTSNLASGSMSWYGSGYGNLSLDEVIAIRDNPWQLFAPQRAQIPVSWNPDPATLNASIAHGPYPLVARPSVLTSVNKQIRSEQSDLVSTPSAIAVNNGFLQLLAFGDSAIIDTISNRVLPLTAGSAPVRRTSTAGVGARYGNSGGSQYLYLTCPGTLAGTVVWYGETHDLSPCIYRADPSTGVLLYSNAGSIYMRSNGVDATGAGLSGAFPANKPVCIILTGDATGCRIYCNGKEVGTIAAAWKWTSASVALAMHLNGPSSGAGCDATDYIVGISEKSIPASLAADMSSNPWQLFSRKTVQPFPGPRRKLM